MNDFYHYELIKKDHAKIIARIFLNKEHPVYQGHFPGNPVVPGVCQVQMIKEIISSQYKEDLVMKKARDIKFVTMINPDEIEVLDMEIELKEIENGYSVNGKLTSGESIFLKIRSEFHAV